MASSIGPNFNTPSVCPQAPAQKKHFGDGIKEAFHHTVDGFKATGHEIADSARYGAQSVRGSQTFGQAAKAGAAAGAQIGHAVGKELEVPGGIALGVAGLAVAGPAGAVLAGIYGGGLAGEAVGKDIGEAVGNHSLAHGGTDVDALADKKAGGIVGGIGGCVVGAFSPIAMVYGAAKAGEHVFEPLSRDAGAVIGGGVGIAAHAGHDVGEFAHKTWTTLGNFAHTVAGKASDAAHHIHDQASELAHEVHHKASAWTHRALFQAGEAAYNVGDWAHDQADKFGNV